MATPNQAGLVARSRELHNLAVAEGVEQAEVGDDVDAGGAGSHQHPLSRAGPAVEVRCRDTYQETRPYERQATESFLQEHEKCGSRYYTEVNVERAFFQVINPAWVRVSVS